MQKKLQPPKVHSNVFHFWEENFYLIPQITLDQFLTKFREYVKIYGDYDLTDQQLINIRNTIDPNLTGVISIREFNLFYEIYWNEPSTRRNLLKGEIPLTWKFTPDPISFLKLNLKAEKAPKNAVFQEGETKTIIELEVDELKDKLKFDTRYGKEGCEVALVKKDNPFYENEMFRISNTMEGFKIKDVAKSTRLKFKVEAKPYFLIPGMIIQIGKNNLFKVTSANPFPRKQHKDYYSLIEFLKGDFIEESKRKLYKDVIEFRNTFPEFVQEKYLEVKDDEEKIRLECIEGPNKGDVIDFMYKVVMKGLIYRIGKTKLDCDYCIEETTVSNIHCAFGFDKEGWFIYEEKPSAFGTFIFLPTLEQWKKNQASFSHRIEDGMKLAVEEFIFACNIKPEVRAGSEELNERYKASKARMQE